MRYRKNTWVKKFLTALVIAVVLVALFLVSFTVTSMILKSNQAPDVPEIEEIAGASPTPKPTYEELERMVIEKDARIKELERQLGIGSGDLGDVIVPQQTIAPKPAQKPTQAPAPEVQPEPEVQPAPEVQSAADFAPVAEPVTESAPEVVQ